ncbi:MAG: RsmE family RNA methyltransferase [Erysipelotrichaceae bacterium]|nr:RsmE family RNA methyltransferase [Erysipelotrichaceae bacterium]
MQQFFVEGVINNNEYFPLNSDIKHQLKKVLRAENGYQFRLADEEGSLYLCELMDGDAHIINKLDENNELDVDITVVLSLIKNDKFDFAIQKLTEIGVKRIVPYKARRSVVKEGKGTNKLDRFKKIVREASEQCHRNIVPEICDYADIKTLKNYLSDVNILAYEKETFKKEGFSNLKSVTIIIGPEGGFETGEVEEFVKMGFESVSLGKRILRAETAAIFLSSLIVGANQ